MIASILIILSVGVTPAYAQEQGFSFVKPDFLFAITNWVENIRIDFASQEDKIALIQEFAFDKQTRIDEATARGEAVPLAIEERRLQLIAKVDTIGESKSVIDRFRADLNTLGELNEIRILYSQFPECIENCTDAEKQMFNDKVNSLDSWKEKCSGTFDIDNYDFTNDAFGKLSQLCPDLSKYGKNHLRSAISGYT